MFCQLRPIFGRWLFGAYGLYPIFCFRASVIGEQHFRRCSG